MPSSYSDFLFQPVGNTLSIWQGVYVGLVSNLTGAAYKSDAPTSSAGLWTRAAGIPADIYTVYTSTTGVGLPPGGSWAATSDANYVVGYGDGSLAIGGPFPYVDVTSPAVKVAGATYTLGAKADVQQVADGVMTAASGVLTSASGKFAATDVGKLITVTRAGTSLTNPTVAISGADGGAGATTLPTGTYTFGYTWAAYDGETTLGTSTANYTQGTANHIITLTLPALPAGARSAKIYCTAAPGGAFTGQIIETAGTSYSYTTGLTANGATAPASNTSGAALSTTIASYQSATQVTLTANAATTCTGATVTWGTDDTTAIQNAYSALAALGKGTMLLSPNGHFMSGTLTINAPFINVLGAGIYTTALYYTGSGDCVRLQMPSGGSGGLTFNFIWPGYLRDFTIDGTGAAAGACGLHYGDAVNGEIAVKVRYFRGTGSKGIWMDNRTNWTERIHWYKVNTYHNTTNVLFDVNGGNVSFDHTFMNDLTMDVESLGIVLQNSATVGYGYMNVTANVGGGSTVLQIKDTASLGFNNLPMLMSITAETAGVATGLSIATGAFLYGTGCLDFGAGPFTNTDALATQTNIIFSGRFNCPGIHAMTTSDGTVSMGNFYAQLPSQSRTLISGPPTDTALTGQRYLTNGVTWYEDHRGATSAPNNALEWSIGGSALLGLTTNGQLYSKLAAAPSTSNLGTNVSSATGAGDHKRGQITIVAGASAITAPLRICTVTYNGGITYPTAPFVFVNNATTGAASATTSLSVYGVAAITTGGFDLWLISGNINASATVVADYWVMG